MEEGERRGEFEEGRPSNMRAKRGPSLQVLMSQLKEALAPLPAAQSDQLSDIAKGIAEYYQFHIAKLKSLVEDKQAEIDRKEVSIQGLQNHILALKDENSALITSEKDLIDRLEQTRLQILDKEKDISRFRSSIEEEKAKLFRTKRSEQDWQEELDKLRREIGALRELSALKDEEIEYLKKNLRSVEDEAMDLREQRRELSARVDRLQDGGKDEEKFQIERSSRALMDQIESLKRELQSAKSSWDADVGRDSIRNIRRDNFDRDNTRGKENEENLPPFRAETGRMDPPSSQDNSPFEPPRRRAERRHEMNLENNSAMSFPPTPKQQPDMGNFSAQTRITDPNKGHGNIIAAEYPEEVIKGRLKDRPLGTKLDPSKVQKLQQDIPNFYCEELEVDPVGYLGKLQAREVQLKTQVDKLPSRAKKATEIADRQRLESELEEHRRAIHRIKHSLK